jgi:RNA polymerase sigma factor (sigma-70 family)
MDQVRKSLAHVLEREKARFLRFVRRRLTRISAMDAEDIVSDVILGLLRRADVFGEIESLTSYAYRSLENRMVDFRRFSRDTVSLDAEESLAPGVSAQLSDPDTPEHGAARLELRERLLWAVGQLGPPERAVWIATEIDGRGFRELAEEWDKPLGTLLSRKSRANARLRQLLKDFNPQ